MTYNILQYVGALVPGEEVPAEKFPAGTDFERLIARGAISPIDTSSPSALKAQNAALRKQLADAENRIIELERSS